MANKKVSLSKGRPPATRKSASAQSAATTRSIIRSHHQLHKAHAQAVKAKDDSKAASLLRQIEDSGGLKTYQQASITGQSASRGGDSSKVLIEWLDELGLSKQDEISRKLRLLEVGALSIQNACSRSGLFEVTRIDLNSQHPGIQQQDFMDRPKPTDDSEAFDVLSLSLVLNYVPDALGRGAMLRHTRQFLRRPAAAISQIVLPILFFVLPEPCVKNSRYLTQTHLHAIMDTLGYHVLKERITAKLYYSLWRYRPDPEQKRVPFKKTELLGGASRNNFAIVIK